MTTNVTITISDAARLEEAASLEGYLRQRCTLLRQYALDLEARIENMKELQAKIAEEHAKALDEKEAELSARIAGLEDALRLARGAMATAEVSADGE